MEIPDRIINAGISKCIPDGISACVLKNPDGILELYLKGFLQEPLQ